ncbi:MAG: sigma-70 family RNA polymerase sigma factor [Ruminococcus sp.]|nr:sigma-70 family RNA polymerase sigma factor [Ruminococcus sp.]
MFNELSDEELALKARDEKDAASELIARYMGTVEMTAKKLAPALSDDLMQEGLMGLMRAVQGYRPDMGASFSSYASVCIKNRMISSLGKNSMSDAADISDSELEEFVGVSDDDIPENIVIEQERMNELYTKISSALSEQEWQVFQLFLKDMSYNQIASTSGLPVKAVDNAMQRVRRKLKSLLG